MDDQAAAIGRRVRYWRKRRNLDRPQFARLVGRSTSWVDKIEKGERSLLRLPMLEQVAEVLTIDVTVLTDGWAAERARDCVDGVEIQAIKAALGRYPSFAPGDTDCSVSTGVVERQLRYVEHAWSLSHFTVVSQHLPRLLDNAQKCALCIPAAHQVNAYRMLVGAYRLASSTLLKFNANDVAWLAADRAMNAAVAVDDPVALARATRSVGRSMSSGGQRTEAIAVLIAMADRIRPILKGREHELLALYGMLLLASSIAASHQKDAALTFTMHQEAESAANQMKATYQAHQTSFSPANVAAHRVATLVRLHEGGRALEYTKSIDTSLIGSLPAERRSNYFLDLSQAFTQSGFHSDAVRSLGDAERIAPEEVRCRPVTHSLLLSLLNKTTGESNRLVRQMAGRAGLTV